jgi:hypothetical protein
MEPTGASQPARKEVQMKLGGWWVVAGDTAEMELRRQGFEAAHKRRGWVFMVPTAATGNDKQLNISKEAQS